MKNRLRSIFNFSLVMLDLYKMREQGPQSEDSAVRGANNMTGYICSSVGIGRQNGLKHR